MSRSLFRAAGSIFPDSTALFIASSTSSGDSEMKDDFGFGFLQRSFVVKGTATGWPVWSGTTGCQVGLVQGSVS